MSSKGNGRLEVTAWTEQPAGMTKRAVVRVGDDLYYFEHFDERPAEKLGDGAMAAVVEREAKLAQRERRISEEAARIQRKREKGEERFKELAALEKSLRDLDEQGRREHQLDVLIVQSEAMRAEAKAQLEEAGDVRAAAKRKLASAELSIRRAVSRERTQAEEVHQNGRAVLKHLEDKLAEVGKKEALLDRRLEAMTNLMCGNVRDFMEDFK